MLHDGCSTGPPPTPPPTADYHVTSNTTNTSSPVTQTFPRFHPEASAGAPAPSSCALAMRGCIVKCVNSQAPADMGIDARHVTAAQCGFVVVLSDRPRTVQEKRAREQSRSHSTCRMSCSHPASTTELLWCLCFRGRCRGLNSRIDRLEFLDLLRDLGLDYRLVLLALAGLRHSLKEVAALFDLARHSIELLLSVTRTRGPGEKAMRSAKVGAQAAAAH